MEQFLWIEKYRPTRIADCILPPLIKETAASFVAQGDLPNMILCGDPGMGKTTLALAMCHELDVTTLFINGSEENGIDILRTKIRDFASTLSLDGKRKYVIIDEADYLNMNSTQPALRGMMEEFASNCGFILTCNYVNRLIPALHSRCTTFSFKIGADQKKHLMAATLDRLQTILASENITAEETLLIKVIKQWWPDIRRMINEIQRSCLNGELTTGVLGQQSDVQFEPLYAALKSKNYTEARKWIGQHPDIDPAKFYRSVFDWVHSNAQTTCLAALIVLIADYQYKHLSAIDPQVHLAAFCVEVMHHGQFS